MYEANIIESIRILPNDKKTFVTEEEFKNFIEKQLIDRGGYYYFPNQMMRCPDNTLVLFQYDGKIRAAGILVESEKIQTYDEEGNEYSGYYMFDIDTIYILNEPISKEKMQEINPEFKNFNQSKQIVSLDYLEDVLKILVNNR
ncbi:hypothetical protein [Clostridium algidicarnis]|uniref:hypothetical protein n=1 Tax=Clostridium algidicarnis TaxID=37659 RepID=UPI001C0C03AB|nr:hypothetical protein [Clostridium algidicarnis]MBU3194631.1 hypothetical protein [Clostridium algidicarnis]MBU3207936.1 hypothetical protein [Clostridium algidicarnis]